MKTLRRGTKAGAVGALLLTWILLAGCSSAPLAPPDLSGVVPFSETAAPPSTEYSGHDVVVFLDASASMKGFVCLSGESVFCLALRELRNVASGIGTLNSLSVRRVDSGIGEPMGDVRLSQASTDPRFFSGAETNLAGAVRAMDTPPAGTPAGAGRAPSPRVARIRILVTDGVQSADQASASGSFDAGSDPVSVRRQILALVSRGWGVTVLGLRSQFHGPLFSEILKGRGERYTLPFDTDDRNPATFRPFFLYVFSPDPQALRTFTRQLRDRLKGRPGIGEVREFAVSVPCFEGAAKPDLAVVSAEKELARVELKVREEKPGSSRKAEFFLVRLDPAVDEKKGVVLEARVPLKWTESALASLDEAAWGKLLRWEVVPKDIGGRKGKADRQRLPGLRVESCRYEKGTAVVRLSAFWPRALGTPDWGLFNLTGSVVIDETAAVPAWVKAWSTDVDQSPAHGNRTLFLESQLMGLWRNPGVNGQKCCDAWVCVGPK